MAARANEHIFVLPFTPLILYIHLGGKGASCFTYKSFAFLQNFFLKFFFPVLLSLVVRRVLLVEYKKIFYVMNLH